MKKQEFLAEVRKLQKIKEQEAGQKLFGGEGDKIKMIPFSSISQLEKLKSRALCPEGIEFLDAIIQCRKEWARGMNNARREKNLEDGGKNNLSEGIKIEDDEVSKAFHYLKQIGYREDDEYPMLEDF